MDNQSSDELINKFLIAPDGAAQAGFRRVFIGLVQSDSEGQEWLRAAHVLPGTAKGSTSLQAGSRTKADENAAKVLGPYREMPAQPGDTNGDAIHQDEQSAPDVGRTRSEKRYPTNFRQERPDVSQQAVNMPQGCLDFWEERVA